MSVPLHKRTLSNLEFYKKAMWLRRDVSLSFLKIFSEHLESTNEFYQLMGKHFIANVLKILFELTSNIAKSNSIFPTTLEECVERRSYQNAAIGNCSQLIGELEAIAYSFKEEVPKLAIYSEEAKATRKLLRGWKQTTAKYEKAIKDKMVSTSNEDV